jgi:hypothetical protein
MNPRRPILRSPRAALLLLAAAVSTAAAAPDPDAWARWVTEEDHARMRAEILHAPIQDLAPLLPLLHSLAERGGIEAPMALTVERLVRDQGAAGLRALSALPLPFRLKDQLITSGLRVLDPLALQRLAGEEAAAPDSLLLDACAQALLKQSPEAAQAWAESRQDPAASARARAAVLRAWAPRDPARAADWALRRARGAETLEGVERVLEHWCDTDPVAAWSWIQRWEDGPVRTRLITVWAGCWGAADPVAMAKLLGPSGGKERDAALAAYIAIIREGQPALAARWAEAIHDPALRRQAFAPSTP